MLTKEEIIAFQEAWDSVFKEQLSDEEVEIKVKQLMQAYALLAKYARPD